MSVSALTATALSGPQKQAVALLTGMRTYPGVRVYSADTSSDDREIRRAIRRERRGRQ
jgi:hypothetical protein